MALVHQIDTFSPDAWVKTAYLNGALSILLSTIVLERHAFTTRTVTALERSYNWWEFESDRLARPNPIPLLYANTKQYIDYQTFDLDTDDDSDGHYLFYDFIFPDATLVMPEFDSSDTDSVLVDMMASALYSIGVLEDFHVGYAYMSFMYGLSSLIQINETQKPQSKQPTVITIKPLEI